MRYQYPLKEPYREGTKYGVKGSMWSCGWHSGQDFYSMSAGGDGKIYPVAEGKVIKVSTTGSYGNSVRVEHGDGYISLYAHMSKINVKQGQEVKEGTVLGIEGSTGNSTARHLHIEIHKGAYSYPSKIDPLKFLKERVEEDMTEKETKEMIEKAIAESKPVTYDKLSEVPDWGRDTIDKLIKKGYIKGEGNKLNISYDLLRTLVINDRAGLYN